MHRNGPYKVDSPKTAMADLTEVCKQLFWVISIKQVCHLRVLDIAPSTRWHGQGLAEGEEGFMDLMEKINTIII